MIPYVRRGSGSGIYENMEDLNNTYEEPMTPPPVHKEFHPKRYT